MSNEKPVGRPKKYSHSALGSFFDDKSREWKLVKISYNTQGESGDMEILHSHTDKIEIDYQFKIAAANLNVVG